MLDKKKTKKKSVAKSTRSTKKTKNTKATKSNSPKKINKEKQVSSVNVEILGLFLIVFGIISFISLYSNKMGIVGIFLYKFFSLTLGSGNFIMPILFIVWGIILNNKNLIKSYKRYTIGMSLILLSILIILDGSKPYDLTLIDRIQLSLEYADVARSGGIIGAVFGFFMYKLFGSIGTYTILAVVILINIYFILKLNILDITDLFKNLKIKFEEHKEKSIEAKRLKELEKEKNKEIVKEKNNKKPKKKEIKDKKEDKEEKKKNVVITEYSSNNKVNENNEEVDIKEEALDSNTDLDEDVSLEEIDELEKSNYVFPPIELLDTTELKNNTSRDEIIRNGEIIEETMENFGIDSKIVAINKGPVITCYELEPAPGVKLSKIVALNDNIAMSLASSDIRIEAPIPGKSAVGIEVPNKIKDPVSVREIIESDVYENINTDLPLALGKDVSGEIIISSIDKMPHLLIAGATGSGKSVCINTILTSILYKSSPEEVKLMLIDPKVVELNVYNGIPHLLIPVVTDPKKAALALSWAVGEMEKRYKLFAENSVRDLSAYNKKLEKNNRKNEKLPKIVIVVDELADLMMVSANEVEDYIARLAQMARAAGIYLIIATQRPSVDVITGTIKANIPSRIAFAVSSAIDSRTILDMGGAEKLLGKGDMLFYPSFYSKPQRVQGAFISDEEVENIVDFIKANSSNIKEDKLEEAITQEIEKKNNNTQSEKDPLFFDALSYVVNEEQASISFLQRKLRIGYSRAARIVDQMEEVGILGPHEGSKPRSLLMSKEEIEKILEEINE